MTNEQKEEEIEYRLARWILANLHYNGLLTDDQFRDCQKSLMNMSKSIYRRLDWIYDPDTEAEFARTYKNLYRYFLYCGRCGHFYMRRPHHGHSVWQCSSVSTCYCYNPFLYSEVLQYVLCSIVKKFIKNYPGSVKRCKRVLEMNGVDFAISHKIRGFRYDDVMDLWKIIDKAEVTPERVLQVRFINGKKVFSEFPDYSPVMKRNKLKVEGEKQ